MSQPTLSDVMSAVTTLHGDVKVALDRTVTLEKNQNRMEERQVKQGHDLATVKAQATTFGTLASALVVGVIEGTKALIGGHGGS